MRGRRVWIFDALLGLFTLCFIISANNVAFAQVPDVSGQWRTMRPSGQYAFVVTQDGNQVTGKSNLSGFQGTLTGNVMTGTFHDINVSGRFQVTFSDDGSRFDGSLQTQLGTSAGPVHDPAVWRLPPKASYVLVSVSTRCKHRARPTRSRPRGFILDNALWA